MDWDVIQSFLAVVAAGGVGAGARRLGVSENTLRRRLDALEAAAGEPLFDRRGRRIAPTATALKLVEVAARMEAHLASAAAAAQASGGAAAGEVRLSANHLIALDLLPPLFAELHRRHPQLVVRLSVDERDGDLLRGEADVAVRMTRPTQKSIVTRQISLGQLGLYAHRAYLEAHGGVGGCTPAGARHLAKSPALGARRILQEMGLQAPPLRPEARPVSGMGQLTAIRAGLGVGVAPIAVAGREADLVRVAPQLSARPAAWVCVHEDLRESPRVRLLFDAVVRFFEPAAGDDRQEGGGAGVADRTILEGG